MRTEIKIHCSKCGGDLEADLVGGVLKVKPCYNCHDKIEVNVNVERNTIYIDTESDD